MKVSRRTLIKGAGAVTAVLPSARALAREAPALVIYDSRLSVSRAFARRHSAPKIDVATEDANLWRALRSSTAQGRVIGLTRWNDLIIARGYLEERGKRLRGEVPDGNLYLWDMA